MHVILTTIFVQIMGPGLGLYGPIGSMAKACDGMRAEIEEIFTGYLVMVVFFAFSTLMSFWVLMSVPAAIASTTIFVLSSTQWWKYCTRIYNRFAFDVVSVNFDEKTRAQSSSFDEGDDSSLDPGNKQLPAASTQQSSAKSKKTFVERMRGGGGGDSNSGKTNDKGSATSPSEAEDQGSTKANSVGLMQGYLTTRTDNAKGQWRLSTAKWVREYFFVSATGNLYYYKSKDACPHHPLNKRPIRLNLYDITVCTQAGSNEMDQLFEIQLALKDKSEGAKVWTLRMDTDSELQEWFAALAKGAGIKS